MPRYSSSIVQVFCGRYPQASIADHPGRVLNMMQAWSWPIITPGLYEWIYLLGVFDFRGPLIVTEEEGKALLQADRLPSPFALRDMTQPHPDLGTKADLKRLIQSIHEAGGKVILDVVPNQTGLAHPWLKNHPEWYRHEDGQVKKLFSGDVAALDYSHPGVREAMLEQLTMLTEYKADGWRCDMAHLVPADFWQDAFLRVRVKQPKLWCIAEVYGESVFDWHNQNSLLAAGFDAVYDSYFFQNIKFINESGWQPWVNYVNYLIGSDIGSRLVHYLANHDDSLPASLGRWVEGLTVMGLLLPGQWLIYQGVFQGLRQRLAHHWLELLTEKQAQLSAVPDWYVTLKKIQRAAYPRLTQVELAPDWVKGELKSKLGLGQIWVNISQADQPIPDRTSKLKGWLHPGQLKLKPGQAEIFL